MSIFEELENDPIDDVDIINTHQVNADNDEVDDADNDEVDDDLKYFKKFTKK